MAIQVKNLATGEVVKVNNVQNMNGQLVAEKANPQPKNKFYDKYTFLTDSGERYERDGVEKACVVFALAEGFEVVKGRQKAASTATNDVTDEATNDATNDVTDDVTNDVTDDVTNDVTNDVTDEATNEATNDATNDVTDDVTDEATNEATNNATNDVTDDVTNDVTAEALALYSLIAKVRKEKKIDEQKVREISESVIKGWMKAATEKQIADVVKWIKKEEGSNDVVKCDQFDEMVDDLKDGFYPYLVGAAGCGKSVTAKQLADELGLDFYPMQQVLFSHQVEGYGDAGGNYVPTPLYNAFKYGGLVFFDEWDGSQPEAAIIVNNLLANGEYSFPVVGHVTAHPKFRAVFAGNTFGKGGDDEYTGRFVLDGSSRDRVISYPMTYNRRVEMKIANGNEELVDFIEDVRNAIKKTGITHIVSYRATKYAATKSAKGWDKKGIILRGILKFLEIDEMRLIYGALSNLKNEWAVALYDIVNPNNDNQ